MRYGLLILVAGYAAVLSGLHALGRFPRPGSRDVAALIGTPSIRVAGRVMDFPSIRWNQTRFVLSGRSTFPDGFHGRLLVTLAFPCPDLALGDDIDLRGWPSAPRPASPHHPFDEAGYWASQDVYALLKVWSPEGLLARRPAPSRSWRHAVGRFRDRFCAFWRRALPPDEAGFVLGLTMGSKGVLPADLKQQCIRAGVYHLVVVSGQNVTLLIAAAVGLFTRTGFPRRWMIVLTAAPVLFYCSVTGGDPPVVRATWMALYALSVRALARDVPPVYPLVFSAGWLLLAQPQALFGASFQLSFGATASLFLGMRVLNDPGGRPAVVRWLLRALMADLIVHLGIWPLLVYYFHQLSIAGLAAPFSVFPLGALAMAGGLMLGAWGAAVPWGVPPMAITVYGGLIRALLGLIHLLSGWRWAVVPLAPPPVWAIVLYYAAVFGILLWYHRRQQNA